jgi:hypothetical protein
MSIRFERRRVRVAYQWCDPLGYLYCHDCTPEEKRPELELTCSEERCERCGRPVGAVTVETWATVAVEYFSCKIF